MFRLMPWVVPVVALVLWMIHREVSVGRGKPSLVTRLLLFVGFPIFGVVVYAWVWRTDHEQRLLAYGSDDVGFSLLPEALLAETFVLWLICWALEFVVIRAVRRRSAS